MQIAPANDMADHHGVALKPKIVARKQGRAGRITLYCPTNREPLDIETCELMKSTLVTWMNDESVELVIVDRADSARNLCASATALTLSLSARTVGLNALPFLKAYSQLCYVIASYPKPYVSLIDGGTTGEGLGLSLLGTCQVATERAFVSFSETGYGSIPNAAASFYLSKLEGEIGTWLALTGNRLNGIDASAIGLTSHFCARSHLSELSRSLASNGIQALDNCNVGSDMSFLEFRAEMDDAFSGDCAKAIKRKLERGSGWAKRQATKIGSKSPLSTKIALRLIRTGGYLESEKEALIIEHRVRSRLVCSLNYKEGVRAVFEDRDYRPRWNPCSLQHATFDMVSQYFSPLRENEVHLPSFSNIPHARFVCQNVH